MNRRNENKTKSKQVKLRELLRNIDNSDYWKDDNLAENPVLHDQEN